MKKLLIICLLAVFTFSLAGSVSAAVDTVLITLPTDHQLNYGTTQPITWTHNSTVTVPKFNISLIEAVGTVTPKPIATQVLCKAPTATDPCTFSWKVGRLKSGRFVMGTDYKIKVCDATTISPTCSESAAFKIVPPALRNQQEVLDLFYTAIDNHYKDLNAYDRATDNYRTGVAGVRDFIMVNTGTAAAPNYRISTTTANAVDTVTGTNKKIYAMTTIEQFVWFKSMFIALSGTFLNPRDRAGISYAMSNRYKDFCANDRVVSINAMTKIYNTAVAAQEIIKQQAIKNANTAYNNSVKALTGTNTFKLVRTESLKIVRDRAINTAYDTFYTNTDEARSTLTNTYGNGQTTLAGDGIEGAYYDCINNARVITWSWN